MGETVHYTLSWQQPNDHLFDIRIDFVADSASPLLHLPAWRPGRYLIQNYAANVRQWSASGDGGRALPVRKTAKSTWQIESRAGERVSFRYRFYAGVLDAGSSWLDEREAYFNGSNLFMWIEGQRTAPALLNLQTPASWIVETQLTRDDDGSFRARDYDHLIDSPTIAAPRMTQHQFDVAGTTIHLIFVDDDGVDTQQFVEPMRAVAIAHAELFGGLPLRHYRFLYHVGDRWHGVEHEDSTSIILKRAQLFGARPGSEGFDHFLSISSHELFHLWNVKRIMPARFVPYDYSVETPTRLLWAMEGITSYYGDLLLVRAGVWSIATYLDHLGRTIATLENLPGRAFLSLAQSSFDGWLQEPAQMHDKSNAWISFYNKGEIVAALLDLTIRARSDGAKSLDDVMRALWNDYGRSVQAAIDGATDAAPRGLDEDGFARVIREATGLDLDELFADLVDGTTRLPYESIFALAGIAFTSEPARTELTLGARFAWDRLVVDSVTAGGAAMAAGLVAGDELLAVGRQRTASESDVRRALSLLHDGEETELLFARNGIVQTHAAVPRLDETRRITLRVLDGATETEQAIREGWLLGRTAGKEMND